MYLASVSKQFTAALIYGLVEQGKLRLDARAGVRIPELGEVSGKVTVQQLLNHTSGLRDYGALREVAGKLEPIDNQGVIRVLGSQRGLNFEPGSDYEYSNSDYVVLAVLAERASGLTMATLAKKEIFSRHGMKSAWIQGGGETAVAPAHGYSVRDGKPHLSEPPPATTGDGGVYASVSDLLRWMNGIPTLIHVPARLSTGEVLPHASGLFWGRFQGRKTLSHNGSVSGYQADVVNFPKERLSVVCLCNRGDVDANSLSRQIAEAYLGTGRTVGKTMHKPAADLAGKWQSRQGFVLTTKVEDDKLTATLQGEAHVFSRELGHHALAGDGLTLRRRGKDTLELGWEGDRPNRFQRMPAATRAHDSGEYIGRFVNDELAVAWDLRVEKGVLVITNAAGWRIPLQQAVEDRFEVGPWLLDFERKSGQVVGFRLHRERLWNLRFERRPGVPNLPGR